MRTPSPVHLSAIAFAILSALPWAHAQEIPWPRPVVGEATVRIWDFAAEVAPAPASGWRPENAVLTAEVDGLRVESSGEDPYLIGPGFEPLTGEFVLRVVSTSTIPGTNSCYWATATAPGFSEARRADDMRGVLRIEAGCAVREITLGRVDGLNQIRLDPGAGVGRATLRRLELVALRRADVWVENLSASTGDFGSEVEVAVRNRGKGYLPLPGQDLPLAPGGLRKVRFTTAGHGVFAEFRLDEFLAEPARPAIHVHTFTSEWTDDCRTAALAGDPDGRLVPNGLVVRRDDLRLEVAEDGVGAVLHDGLRVRAILHPIALLDGLAVRFAARIVDGAVQLESERATATLRILENGQVDVRLLATGDDEIEGPVLRTPTEHRRAVFPGVEYLSRGEPSSSDRDCETRARLRYAPDRRWVTWPFAAFEGHELWNPEQQEELRPNTVAISWRPAILQPVFAAPDRYDGMRGPRFALRGRAIHAMIDLGARDLDDAILRAARRQRLPKPPSDGLRDRDWRALCLQALRGPLFEDGKGWGHCAEPRWARTHFVDFASALWRLDPETPLPGIESPRAPGGAHLHDDTICLVEGNATIWRKRLRDETVGLLGTQDVSGSYAYSGEYLRGHFANTPHASGFSGFRAARLLEIARLLGDDRALEAGLKALEAIEREHRTPRGAQTWELSLHTPDILAAAHLVRAHVQAFELTGEKTHLGHARTWAARGLPFVYLRQDRDVMPYATIAVLGATNWRAPVWFGQPVQWCGLVYADSLARLAAHDDDALWRQVAEGILAAGRAMQYPDGPLAGCLPDYWLAPSERGATGRGGGPSINPIALLHLDARLRGEPWQVHTASRDADPGERVRHVAAPYPVHWDRKLGAFVVRTPDGPSTYSYVVDGMRSARTNARLIRPGD